MYILDTDTISNLIKKNPSTRLIQKLAQTPVEQQFTTAITIGELVYGASRLPNGEILWKRVEAHVSSLAVLAFDYDAALTYGKIRGGLEKKGIVVAEADLRIGSIALTRKMKVITGNFRHFEKIPDLLIENWI